MHDEKYIMIGTPVITKELFRKVLRPLNTYGLKPSGGFWASKHLFNDYLISPWFSYLTKNATSIARYKDLNNSVIFSLKENSKILTINNINQVMELCKNYPSYHHILGYHKEITDSNKTFDYEKLSQDYDGIYIDFNYFQNQIETNIFDSFSCNSILLFNLECIKEFQTAPIMFDIDNRYSIPHIKEESISSPTIINEESNEHKILSILSQEIFKELISKYDNYIFIDYDDYLTKIIETTKKVIDLLIKNEEEKITQIKESLKENNLIVKKYLIVYNIVLNYLSFYLNEDIERIKKIPKTKIRELKSYQL